MHFFPLVVFLFFNHRHLVQPVLGLVPGPVPNRGELSSRAPNADSQPVLAWAKSKIARQLPGLAAAEGGAAEEGGVNAAQPATAATVATLPPGSPGKPPGLTSTTAGDVAAPAPVQPVAAEQSRIGQSINCAGSYRCKMKGKDIIQQVLDQINANVADSATFTNGQHITCQIHFCAFLQRCSRTYSGLEIKSLMGDLIGHGCGTCGSAPVSGENSDVGFGMLTVNYVDNLP